MLLEKKELSRLCALASDIKSGLLPSHVASSALFAFFVENPHLLMADRFDEHIQRQLKPWQYRILEETQSLGVHYRGYLLPHLEFRTPEGRWAGLIGVPGLEGDDCDIPEFLFSFSARDALGRKVDWEAGRFTAGVIEEKSREENRLRLFLKDGLAIGDMVRCHFRLDADIRRTWGGCSSRLPETMK
jgi:hypothetical protein